MKRFSLLDEQKPHFRRAQARIGKYGFYADNSVMGCGKTYVACATAKKLGLPLFIVCPLTVQSNWNAVAEEADVKVLFITTPQSLASKRDLQPKHGYLKRADRKGCPPIFTPTSLLEDVVSEGAFFVFDEIQFARNTNTYFLACKTITACVGLFESTEIATPSRCAFISTTPFDAKGKCLNFLGLINLIKDVGMKSKQGLESEMVEDLEYFCSTYGPKVSNVPKTTSELYTFFISHLQPKLFTSMPLILEKGCDVRNGFYTIHKEEEKEALMAAIAYLNSIFMRIDPETRRIPLNVVKRLTLARLRIEKAKVALFERLVKQELKEAKRKVVLCLHFQDSIDSLSEALKAFEPLVLTGKTKYKDRKKIIDSFQKPNASKRLLICNLRVGGVGISLHDLDGSYPRTMLLSPDHNVTDLFQATGRVNRVGGKSESRIRIVYANLPSCERSILNAIARKMQTIKETLDASVKGVLKLPNDFEDYVESGKRLYEEKKEQVVKIEA